MAPFLGLDTGEWTKLAIPAAGGAIAYLWRAFRKRRAVWRARDERDNATALLVSELAKDVAAIKHEVQTNGGGSLKDDVLALSKAFRVEQVARRVGQGKASWEGLCDLNGEVIPMHVSPEWIRITGLSKDDTVNGGWIRAVAPEDRNQVVKASDNAFENTTVLAVEYHAINVLTGAETFVRLTGIPVLNVNGSVAGWVMELAELPPRERRGFPSTVPNPEEV